MSPEFNEMRNSLRRKAGWTDKEIQEEESKREMWDALNRVDYSRMTGKEIIEHIMKNGKNKE